MKIYNISISISFLFLSVLNANDSFLSKTKKDIINYSYQKAQEDSQKLKNDWINPITYTYSNNKSDSYKNNNSIISISQPIFKSGGIYYAIKYANSVKKQTNTKIDIQKKELIKQTISLIYEIKKINISLDKQLLLIKNAKIDVERKKEQVLNGILDTSFLDNSILDSNIKQNTLIDLEYQRNTLINNLSLLSDKKYTELELPIFSLINPQNFQDNNIYINQIKDDIQSSYWLKNMTTANYLPTVNLIASYTKYHDGDDSGLEENKKLGFNITIPFDIKYSNTIQSSKITYLQNKASLEEKKKEEQIIFNNSSDMIKSINQKILIAKNNIELYSSLVTQIKEQFDVGMKTESDLLTIQNSKKIKELEIHSLNVDKQIELLEIYTRIQE